MPTHETAPAATSAAFGGADVPPESAEHGASTLATALPLLVSPALAKFASGVEAVMNSQVSFIFKAPSITRPLSVLISFSSPFSQTSQEYWSVCKLKFCDWMLHPQPQRRWRRAAVEPLWFLASDVHATQVAAAEKLKSCRKMIER